MGWALGEVRGNDDTREIPCPLNDVVPRYDTTIASFIWSLCGMCSSEPPSLCN